MAVGMTVDMGDQEIMALPHFPGDRKISRFVDRNRGPCIYGGTDEDQTQTGPLPVVYEFLSKHDTFVGHHPWRCMDIQVNCLRCLVAFLFYFRLECSLFPRTTRKISKALPERNERDSFAGNWQGEEKSVSRQQGKIPVEDHGPAVSQ